MGYYDYVTIPMSILSHQSLMLTPVFGATPSSAFCAEPFAAYPPMTELKAILRCRFLRRV